MEDKKTLLAFLFIGIILFSIPYYDKLIGNTSEMPSEVPEPTQPSSREVVQEPNENKKPDVVPPTPSVIEPIPKSSQSVDISSDQFVSRDIVINTPLQRLIFSTAGGVLTSAQLLKYIYFADQNVELLAPGGQGLILTLSDLEWTEDLRTTEFVPDKESINLGPGEKETLIFRADLGSGRSIEKHLHFDAERYGIDIEISINGFSEDVWAYIGWEKGIGLAEENIDTDLMEIRALAYMQGELKDLRTEGPDIEVWDDKGRLKWAGVRNKYFAAFLIPQDSQSQYSVKLDAQTVDNEPYKSHNVSVGKRIGQHNLKNTLYLGPLDVERLSQYEVELERAVDLGWPIIRQISQALLSFFVSLHNYIPNYGWVIIIFATIVKIVLYPLTHKMYQSTARMQEIQPQINALKDKHKSDPQRQQREMMKLYKEEGVNPLGGCLPMLPQMPIFFAMYQMFLSAIELRQTPFLWIADLSQPDTIMIGGFALHLLPLLMAASMFIQQKMTIKDPKQIALVYIMPLVMIFFFWNMSAGLVLYWTTFNVFTFCQQWLVSNFKKSPQVTPVSTVKRK